MTQVIAVFGEKDLEFAYAAIKLCRIPRFGLNQHYKMLFLVNQDHVPIPHLCAPLEPPT